MQLDALDQQLLQLLQANARLSSSELARRLGVSRTTIHARLARLEGGGTIRGYTVRLGDDLEDTHVKAHVLLTCAPRHTGKVEAALKAIAEVRTVMSVSGPFDMIVAISAPTASKLDALLDRIGELEGVERTTSSIILSTRLDR